MSSDFERIQDAQVVVNRVSKAYGVSHGTSRDLKRFRRPPRTVAHALTDVSLLARSGESIGIMGRNGSGKSTLLRLIAGTEAPTEGQVLVRHVPSILGVTPALVPHLDAWDNARIGLLALGLSRSEAKSLVGEVVEWTGLGDEANRPMRTYSSGQSARLSFAISTVIRPKILIVDEALATGDMGFVSKARSRMEEVLDEAGTLFLVSHSITDVERICTRTIWLNGGQIVADGETAVVSGSYKKWQHLNSYGEYEAADQQLALSKKVYPPREFILDRETG